MMYRLLISNLGKGRKENGGRYKNATYKFPNDAEEKSQMFGLALLKWLADNDKKPDKIVLLGTTGSMWDSLLELDEVQEVLDDSGYNLYNLLTSKAERSAVTTEDLTELSNFLSKALKIDFQCRLIPYGMDSDEQQQILSIIAEEVPEGSEVIFDFTHGLRHLPLFGLLSSFHLRACRQSQVTAIYYAALELSRENDGKAPVMSLDFALDSIAWIKALALSEDSGNLKALADMDGIKDTLAENLKTLSFMRNTNQVGEMKKYANQSQKILRHEDALPPAGELYRTAIEERLAWCEAKSYAHRQLEVARQALEKSNYSQCVTMAYEAFISSRIDNDPLNFDAREKAKNELNSSQNKTYKILNKLRNAIAHGSRPQGHQHWKDKNTDSPAQKVQRMLGDEKLMLSTLEGFINNIEQSLHSKGK